MKHLRRICILIALTLAFCLALHTHAATPPDREAFVPLKEPEYWAGVFLEIGDYADGSGDTKALGLEKGSAGYERLRKAAVKAFITYRSKGLPYYDDIAAKGEGLVRITNKHHFGPMDKYRPAREENAKSRELLADELRKQHGENAGVIALIIVLKREGAAVLYEIRVYRGVGVELLADKHVAAKMGVSAPETLTDDLERTLIAVMKKEKGTYSAPLSPLW